MGDVRVNSVTVTKNNTAARIGDIITLSGKGRPNIELIEEVNKTKIENDVHARNIHHACSQSLALWKGLGSLQQSDMKPEDSVANIEQGDGSKHRESEQAYFCRVDLDDSCEPRVVISSLEWCCQSKENLLDGVLRPKPREPPSDGQVRTSIIEDLVYVYSVLYAVMMI
nr:hypothetical protein [Tanacetum cinerariifolium]